jgi:crotonobetainyl-CoA:carnitine CoA-transferase CaiB-like acyl-CoA transferase
MDGVRVVELGVWVAGPAAAGVLADWGADVVKIEPPTGDPARSFRFLLGGDMPTNPVFELDNRSKRSVVLDLTTEGGRAVALDLVDRADVFVTNLRTAALARLGLDPDTLRARNSRLVYCSITGYGLEGPDADTPGFDIAGFWARAGIAGLLTAPGGEPPFQRGGMGDHSTGMAAAGAVAAALFARERTGEGQLVATSLLRQGVYTVGFDLNMLLGWGQIPQIGRRTEMRNPAMNNYRCADGRRLWLVGLEPERHWPPLCRAVGHPEWIEDPRFATLMARARHVDVLIPLLDEIFAQRSLDEWAEIFATEPELFWAPVNTADDILADPQLQPAGALVEVPDGSSGTTMIATPVDFHGTPWAPRSLAPEHGEHTDAVLAELGYPPDRVAELRTAGAIA